MRAKKEKKKEKEEKEKKNFFYQFYPDRICVYLIEKTNLSLAAG